MPALSEIENSTMMALQKSNTGGWRPSHDLAPEGNASVTSHSYTRASIPLEPTTPTPSPLISILPASPFPHLPNSYSFPSPSLLPSLFHPISLFSPKILLGGWGAL